MPSLSVTPPLSRHGHGHYWVFNVVVAPRSCVGIHKQAVGPVLNVEISSLLYLVYLSCVHADAEQTSTSPRTWWLGWLYSRIRMPRPGALDLVSVIILVIA